MNSLISGLSSFTSSIADTFSSASSTVVSNIKGSFSKREALVLAGVVSGVALGYQAYNASSRVKEICEHAIQTIRASVSGLITEQQAVTAHKPPATKTPPPKPSFSELRADIIRNKNSDREGLLEGYFDVNVNETDDRGRTLLHYAVENGAIRAIFFLLIREADQHREDRDGVTPFQLASEKGDFRALAALRPKQIFLPQCHQFWI